MFQVLKLYEHFGDETTFLKIERIRKFRWPDCYGLVSENTQEAYSEYVFLN